MKNNHPHTRPASVKSSVLRDDLDLNLPDAPNFFSTRPQYTVNELIIICQAMLPHWNKQRFVDREPEIREMKEDFVL